MSDDPNDKVASQPYPNYPNRLPEDARQSLEDKIRELLDAPTPTEKEVEKIEKLWRLMTDQEESPKPLRRSRRRLSRRR